MFRMFYVCLFAGTVLNCVHAAPQYGFDGPKILLKTPEGRLVSTTLQQGRPAWGNFQNETGHSIWEVWDQSGTEISHGTRISLRLVRDGLFLSHQRGASQMVANRTIAADWETFVVVRDAGEGRVKNGDWVYLKAYGHGDYVSVRMDMIGKPLFAQAPLPDSWERFQWIDIHDNERIYDVNQVTTKRTKNNCVLYARERLGGNTKLVPKGLFSLTNKLKVCDVRPSRGHYLSWNQFLADGNRAWVGRMVVIETGQEEGHVAVLEQIHADGTVTIRESNYPYDVSDKKLPNGPGIRSRRGYPGAIPLASDGRPLSNFKSLKIVGLRTGR
ncbi:MAG: hypothetical protein KIT74_00085 [Fimbriimonadales bacterium]|nr:hypothetical protein [Fimbriimonadales bacterium]